MTLHVFIYDIADNKRRNRAAKALASVATRVQESVFEGYLDAQTLSSTMGRLQGILHPEQDALRVYTVCATCRQQTKLMGSGRLTPRPAAR